MYRELLPIGSVVLLKEGNKRLMITGRVVARNGGTEISDYVGCYYPQGIVNSNTLFFFDHEAIEAVFFIGFQDQEEIAFREQVLAPLDEGKVVIEDGKITVIKEDA